MKTIILSLAALIALGLSTPSLAQTACKPHAEATKFLYDEYKEAPVAAGLASNGTLIEVYASFTGGTFTILMTTPKGNTCFVATGTDWTDFILKKHGPIS